MDSRGSSDCPPANTLAPSSERRVTPRRARWGRRSRRARASRVAVLPLDRAGRGLLVQRGRVGPAASVRPALPRAGPVPCRKPSSDSRAPASRAVPGCGRCASRRRPRSCPARCPREKLSVIWRWLPIADDDPGGQRHEVDRVGEVDPVLLPDLGAEQTDHPVEDDGDAAEDGARGGVDDGAELGHQAQQDRHDRGHVVGRRGVDAGGRHDADVLGVGGGGGSRRPSWRARCPRRRRTPRGHDRVEVALGHLAHGLDVAGVLGDQRDDGGSTSREKFTRSSGR